MAERGLVLTGARARLSLNGVKVMHALNVNYSEEVQLDPIEPLDQLEVAEHVPVAYRVTFTAQMVRVIRESMKLHRGVAIFPRLEDILSSEELTATVEDRITGLVIANIQRVKAQRYSANIGARAITLSDVNFVAIRIRDESEIV
jgi:hypothetical protein